MRWKGLLIVGLFLAGVAPGVARAQGAPDRIVVFDLTREPRDSATPRVITLPYDLATREALGKIRNPDARDTLLKRLHADDTGPRWVSDLGDSLIAVVLHEAATSADARFNEVPRRTRIASDLVTLGQLAFRVATAQPEFVPPLYQVTEFRYTLGKRRARLLVTASAGPPEQPPVQGSPGKPQAPISADVALITGPEEHFFLSANAGSTNVNQLKYDDESRTLQPRETPTGFTVGFNYAFGDILTSPADMEGSEFQKFFKGVSVGGTLLGSRRPFDQVGASVGFRYNPIKWLRENIVSFETVSPYAGVAWTRNDRVDAEGNRLGGRRFGSASFVWGVSLNLEKALGWAGGK